MHMVIRLPQNHNGRPWSGVPLPLYLLTICMARVPEIHT